MSIVKLPLTNGEVTLVDEDIGKILEGVQIYTTHKKETYAKIYKNGRCMQLQRFIMNPPRNMEVDHINGNHLDNRRQNLRLVTHSQNLLNRRRESLAISGYRLVYKTKYNSWFIKIVEKGKARTFGWFYKSRHVAAVFADQTLVQTVGPFVRKNFQEKISSSYLANFLESTNGRIFRVVFSRRSDGRQREMVCRTGVKARQAGGSILFNPISKNLFSVYDVQKRSYRFIPLENVICIRFAQTNYRVVA